MVTIIRDRIYGKLRINSPVLIELINSAPVQRLKKIAQFGVPDEFYHEVGYSRYEHSIGVLCLLKQLGGNEEEQIAGLLHDVSHTAFSHVMDYIMNSVTTQTYQDSQLERFITESKLQNILKQYNYSPTTIADHHQFSLLEQEAPYLCADRIDYTLRQMPVDDAREVVKGLRVCDKKIVCVDMSTAYLFGHWYMKLQVNDWGGFESVVRYRLFSDVLKRALEIKLIRYEDFWQDDEYIIRLLKNSSDEYIQKILSLLRNKSLAHLPKSDKTIRTKFRFVDPEVLIDETLIPLSTINNKFSQELKSAKRHSEAGVQLPLI